MFILRIFYIDKHFIGKQGQFYLSFSILYCFSFSCFIILVRITRTVLNRSSESGHPCLGLSFRVIAISSSLLAEILENKYSVPN